MQAQAGFTVLPNYSFNDCPAVDAFLIPGGFGTRQEMHNRRLHQFVQSLPEATLLTSVCTGSWVYGRMGLLDGVRATNRKEPDRLEASGFGKVPIDRLAEIAPSCRISRARVVDSGRIVTAGGIASGMELGFHLLRRAGYSEDLVAEVARVMDTAARTSYIARTLSGAQTNEQMRRSDGVKVAAIWRYPVKSMAGERLARYPLISMVLAVTASCRCMTGAVASSPRGVTRACCG